MNELTTAEKVSIGLLILGCFVLAALTPGAVMPPTCCHCNS